MLNPLNSGLNQPNRSGFNNVRHGNIANLMK